MTSFYSWRLAFLTFHGAARWKHDDSHADAHDAHVLAHAVDDDHGDEHGHELHPHESPITMMIPLLVLSIGAVIAGVVFESFFVGSGAEQFWRQSILTLPAHNALEARESVPLWVALSPLVVTVIGFLIAVYYYLLRPERPAQLAANNGLLYNFIKNKWYFDEIYNFLFVGPAFWLGRTLWKLGDGWLIDGFGPDGVATRVKQLAGRAVRLQTGYIYHYAFAMLIGVSALLTWLLAGSVPK